MAAAYAHEQVVEIVGYSAGKLADSLHLLGLAQAGLNYFKLGCALFHLSLQILFQPFSIGYIGRNARKDDRVSGCVASPLSPSANPTHIAGWRHYAVVRVVVSQRGRAEIDGRLPLLPIIRINSRQYIFISECLVRLTAK
jgi:hypothetical protein